MRELLIEANREIERLLGHVSVMQPLLGEQKIEISVFSQQSTSWKISCRKRSLRETSEGLSGTVFGLRWSG